MFAGLNCMAGLGDRLDCGSVSNGGVGIGYGEGKRKSGAERGLAHKDSGEDSFVDLCGKGTNHLCVCTNWNSVFTCSVAF